MAPLVVENGVHEAGCALIHGVERLGSLAEWEHVGTQLCQRKLRKQLDGLQAAAPSTVGG